MKLTRRGGKHRGGIFSVGVRAQLADRFEDALTYLESVEDKTASQIVIELVFIRARQQGWTGTEVQTPRQRDSDTDLLGIKIPGLVAA